MVQPLEALEAALRLCNFWRMRALSAEQCARVHGAKLDPPLEKDLEEISIRTIDRDFELLMPEREKRWFEKG